MNNLDFTTDWFSHNIPNWKKLSAYLHQTFGEDLNCLEVGTWEGRSAIYTLENFVGRGNLTVIDQFRSSDAHRRYKSNIEKQTKKNQVRTIVGLSIIEMAKLLSNNEQYHFVYIDAGKTSIDNLANLILGERLLTVGGLLVVDDYGWNHNSDPKLCPQLGIDSFKNTSLLCEIFDQNYQLVFKKTRPNFYLIEANK